MSHAIEQGHIYKALDLGISSFATFISFFLLARNDSLVEESQRNLCHQKPSSGRLKGQN